MKKIPVIVGVVIIAIVAAATIVLWPKSPVGVADYKKAEYLIDGKKTTVQYFGNEVRHDLNGDGREDVAFIATVSPGGSGTFYYALAALNTPNGYIGSDGVLLGDRIAPQTTEMGKGNIIVVNYADRKFGESFTTQPSIGKSVWLLLDPKTMQFGLVEPNFSGESDMNNLIRLTSPLPNQTISSPLTVTGQARGNWFFEASFPVMLTDWDGKIIAQGIATAQSDWMTTNFVPFTATLNFKTSDISGNYSNRGTLILKKDNPSGLSEKDNALEIPVLIK